MSITDELREWVTDHYSGWKSKQAEGIAIADRIDAEHERQLGVLYRDMSDAEWVRLPKDADGVPFHIGELVDEKLPFGGYAAPAPIDTMELSRGASGYGWMVKLDAENRALISPKLLRHHAPTVEDVLTEMVAKVIERGELTNGAAQTIAEYAKRLKLAEGEDA